MEEIDAAFKEGISARKFTQFIATGAAGRVAGLENDYAVNADDLAAQRKAEFLHLENIDTKDPGTAEQAKSPIELR